LNTPLTKTALALSVFVSALAVSSFSYAGTTTADFLKWERKSQDAFFSTSISMATFVLIQTKPEVAKCVEDWYFTNQSERNASFLQEMPKYQQYHPNAVLIGFIEQTCGKISD